MTKQHRARKRFGQNFLHDTAIIQALVSCIAPQADDHMVEIGPGKGALTEQLQPYVKTLDTIEIDRDLIALLHEKFNHKTNMQMHQGDVLDFDFSRLIKDNEPLRVVGNLPYNITTPLLFHLFSYGDAIRDIMVMLQKEVVLRLVAPVGDHHYGRLSVMAQYFCDMHALLEIPPEAFSPQPKVDSAFLQLIPKKPIVEAQSLDNLRRVVTEAFNQRRKTLANALQNVIPSDGLKRLDINPQLRPQALSVSEFVTISNALEPTS